MDMIKTCIASNIDVFCMGAVMAIIAMKVSDWVIAMADLMVGNAEKKRHILLGEAVKQMHKDLQKMKIE